MLSGKTYDQFTIADIFRDTADVDTVFAVRVKNNNNDELVMVICDYIETVPCYIVIDNAGHNVPRLVRL